MSDDLKRGNIKTTGENYSCEESSEAEMEAFYKKYKAQEKYKCEYVYLVRGALLKCTCGTHPRRVNLTLCHGLKILGNPILYEIDCMVGDEENITSFGVCKSETPPESEEVLLKEYTVPGDTESGKNVKGKLCTPKIIGTWMDTKEDTMIAQNGTTNEFPAVSTHSFLVCACGGLIEPQTSGQEYKD